MKKGTSGKIFFWSLLGVTALIGGGFIYYKYIRKSSTDSDVDIIDTTDTTTSSTTNNTVINPLGKTLIAAFDGAKVYKSSNMELYKTAKKDEWLGTVSKVTDDWYYINSDFYKVPKNAGKLK